MREKTAYRIDLQDDLRCNWVQVQENTADVTHTVYLHAQAAVRVGEADETGFGLPMVEFGFQPFEYGLIKSWCYQDSDGARLEGWGNPLIFPCIMSIETEMHWRVPINNTTTRVVILAVEPDGTTPGVTVRRLPSRTDVTGRYTMTDIYSQDAMAWETQGPVADRADETLGASDVGIAMFRDALAKAIDACASGHGLPAQSCADGGPINLRRWMSGYLPMSAPRDPRVTPRLPRREVFDERHRRFRVPSTTQQFLPPRDSAAEGSDSPGAKPGEKKYGEHNASRQHESGRDETERGADEAKVDLRHETGEPSFSSEPGPSHCT